MELFDRTEINGLQLGIITGELYFDFPNSKVIIPTKRYVQKGQGNFALPGEMARTEDWTLLQGNLAIPKLEYMSKYTGSYDMRILFGDEVELYFTNEMEFDIYKKSKERGEDKKAAMERRFQSIAQRNYVGDPEYVRTLNLLNVEVPSRFKARGM